MTHQEIVTAIERLYPVEMQRVREAREATERDREALQMQCGAIGHVIGRDKPAAGGLGHRCCLVCGMYHLD